jgi:hypothetical protein
MTICKHCGKPLVFIPIPVQCMQWKHASGHYGCNESRPMHSKTYAEPAEEQPKEAA